MLQRRLVQLLALSLDLPADAFRSKFDPPMIYLRPLHYAPDISSPEAGVYGAGAHSDYGMLTILATDGSPGLQVLLNDQWRPVQSVPSAFIINLGDMCERCASVAVRDRAVSCGS